ncbi:unnamed protein product [Peniophora sp. CBMAI 1063]|nr:unnamed protein product [Peniophora sp. CBMAI 1063]
MRERTFARGWVVVLRAPLVKMAAVDPTYPLYPIACTLASVMVFLVLMTSFVRQSWNLGVTFLCFWIFIENITSTASAILWSDNAVIRLYVYCDIVSHLKIITSFVKPMATLIIIRRLHMIATLQSLTPSSERARRLDIALEWTLGLIIPLLLAGPIYYVNQGARFITEEGFGCTNTVTLSAVVLLTYETWNIIPPLISLVFYYPKVIRAYYRQRRDANNFMRSDASSISTNVYLRILALASIDILLTLPIGIVNIALNISSTVVSIDTVPLYPGWTALHSDWEPVSYTYAELETFGRSELARNYFSYWTSPVLAFAIFCLFGVTSEARASYWRIIRAVGDRVGWRRTTRPAKEGHTSLGEIEFGQRPQNMSGLDPEMGSRTPSNINADRSDKDEVIGDEVLGRLTVPGLDSQSVTILQHQASTGDEKSQHRAVAL